MTSTKTQYDDIGVKFNAIKTNSWAATERAHVRRALEPILATAASASSPDRPAVLDLACGTGFHTRFLRDWGAARVLGVDISPAMIAAARASARPEDEGRVAFVEGDARDLGVLELDGSRAPVPTDDGSGDGGGGEEGKFDAVVGFWVLNYASSRAEMAQMWASVAANLRPGGWFVGCVPRLTDEIGALAERRREFDEKHPGREFTWGYPEYPRALDSGEGYAGRLVWRGEGPFHFDWFHLRRELYVRAAREGGMSGEFEFHHVGLLEELKGVVAEDYLEEFNGVGAHCSIITIQK